MNKRPVVLLILDGWGIAPATRGNAIRLAKTPTLDYLMEHYPTTSIQASGEAVGLPWGEMGNSEVGHLTIGAGMVLYQDLPRINHAIADGTFASNKIFAEAIAHVRRHRSQLHLVGLVSPGGVHSFQEHLHALIELCKRENLSDVFIHAFLDGRDTAYNSGKEYLAQLEREVASVGIGTIATVSGRYWAMDRDRHWDRTALVFNAIVYGKAAMTASDATAAIDASYAKSVYDEECAPTVLVTDGVPRATVQEHDAVVFFNFRNDRMRQLVAAFAQPTLTEFDRGAPPQDVYIVTMTEYDPAFPVHVAFPPLVVTEPLAKVISDAGLSQLHIAETEKYAHVTFFLNGGREAPFPNEERSLIQSPHVASYAEQPAMSAPAITTAILTALHDKRFDVIIANFANADMVGHTGNLQATVKGVETLDACLDHIVSEVVRQGGAVIMTADHGNAEEVVKLQTGEIDKEHSANPVPFLVIAQEFAEKNTCSADALERLTPVGFLSDVGPTMLTLLGLPIPTSMTGRSLLPKP